VEAVKAAVWRAGQQITIEERAEPPAERGWALVRVQLTGLCGTDLAIFAGRHQRAQAPLIMGHEMVGTVETVNGEGPVPGTHVAVNPLMSCGLCWPCQHGLPHTCRHLRLLGIDRDGSLADVVAVPISALVPLTRETPLRQAALVEPLAVAVRAVRQASVEAGDSVMIFGGGPIGILTGLVARAAGAAAILVAEPNVERRAVARRVGFVGVDATGPALVDAVRDLTRGVGADVTFDTAGDPAVPPLVSPVTREHGTVVIAGLHHQPAVLDLHALTFAEQRLIGSRVYTREDFSTAVATVEADTLNLGQLPVRVLPLEDALQAFSYASAHPGVVKVLVASSEAVPPEGQSRTDVDSSRT
jgi:(R,R)-butanediol dehydrogenase / meso-butanediol dehydrogenase / diacetyl reductase